eukprot:gene16701-22844_t
MLQVTKPSLVNFFLICLFGLFSPYQSIINKIDSLCLSDLSNLSIKESLLAISNFNHNNNIPSVTREPESLSQIPQNYLFSSTDIVKSPPTVCRYIIGNPKSMINQPNIASLYGFNREEFNDKTILAELADHLPVIYIADTHPEYGTLGYMLNKRSNDKMINIYPELRSFRNRPIFSGGSQGRGSSFTMIHTKTGFPENRAFKGLPGKKDEFKLYFSPDLAMANELCMTNDAKPSDF